MPATKNCSSPSVARSPRTSRRPPAPANAFSAAFLHKVRHLPAPSGLSRAALAGPWEVESVAAGNGRFHAVVRRDEPVAEGGTALGLMLERPTALQLAAAVRPPPGRAPQAPRGDAPRRPHLPRSSGPAGAGGAAAVPRGAVAGGPPGRPGAGDRVAGAGGPGTAGPRAGPAVGASRVGRVPGRVPDFFVGRGAWFGVYSSQSAKGERDGAVSRVNSDLGDRGWRLLE